MSDKKLQRNPSYGNTTVAYERTKAEIETLLRSYGVKGTRWTSMEGQDDVLEFIVEANIRGVKKQIGIAVKPPHIHQRKRIPGRGLGYSENINQEYRLLFHWIKSKIEAVVWGLSTIEKEFLSEVTIQLADGRESSVGEVVLGLVTEDRLRSLPFTEGQRKVDESRVIDVEKEEKAKN